VAAEAEADPWRAAYEAADRVAEQARRLPAMPVVASDASDRATVAALAIVADNSDWMNASFDELVDELALV
jgi:hypothetical protein